MSSRLSRRAEFAAEWEAQGGDLAKLPPSDFTKSMVVAVIEDAGEYIARRHVTSYD